MYIVAIAWLYVLLLVSIMQPTVFRGIVTFVGAGLLPLALLLYLTGTPHRRRSRARAEQASPPAPESADSTNPPQGDPAQKRAAQDTEPRPDPVPPPDKAPITSEAPTR